MFLDSVGIVLRKSCSSSYKLIILDKIQGKIECVIARSLYSTGALITYNIREHHALNFISDSALVYIPLSLAQIDLLFFHHVLELIYYFTHVGSSLTDVFDLLAFLYSVEHTALTTQFKKFFLLKLLTLMGYEPEFNDIRMENINLISKKSIQALSRITIEIADEKLLDVWLWYCVCQHPYVNEFKTVHFLVENRVI